MTRAAAAVVLCLAACPEKRTAPAADAALTAAEGAITVTRDGKAVMTLAPRGAGEWSMTPAGQSARLVKVVRGDVRVTDATGEVLARIRDGQLIDADDQIVGTVTAILTPAMKPAQVVIFVQAAEALVLNVGADGVSERKVGEHEQPVPPTGVQVQGSIDPVLANVLTLERLSLEQRAAVFAFAQTVPPAPAGDFPPPLQQPVQP